jgi:O-methyltransferase domain
MADRCEFTGADFFSSVPGGADAYIMRWIIHDWNDEDSLKILRNCRTAIRRDGTLLIVDSVLKPPNERLSGKTHGLEHVRAGPGRTSRRRFVARCAAAFVPAILWIAFCSRLTIGSTR